jgi:hypothetical protein
MIVKKEKNIKNGKSNKKIKIEKNMKNGNNNNNKKKRN